VSQLSVASVMPRSRALRFEAVFDAHAARLACAQATLACADREVEDAVRMCSWWCTAS